MCLIVIESIFKFKYIKNREEKKETTATTKVIFLNRKRKKNKQQVLNYCLLLLLLQEGTKEGSKERMGVVKVAVLDGVITCMWVFCVSTLGVLTSIVSSALSIEGLLPTLIVTTSLVFLLVFVFGFISNVMGEASFNPTGSASFYAAGIGDDSLLSMALRLPAQVHTRK